MLSALLLFALHIASTLARPGVDLWKLPVNDPAPPPETGPPGAAHADRDHAHLKFDIIGIVGAYFVWILGTGLLILIFGGRMRRRNIALTNGSLKLKMFKLQGKPGPNDLRSSPKDIREESSSKPMSPDSPGKTASVRSWGRKDRDFKATESIQSVPGVGLTPKGPIYNPHHQGRLSDLRAQSMMQDDEKSHTSLQIATISPPSNADENESEYDVGSNPAEQEHLYYSNKLSHPLAPTPRDDEFDEEDIQYSRRNKYRPAKSRPLAIISELGARAGALMSPGRSKKLSDRDMKSPRAKASADLNEEEEYAENVPLSPRLYNPGPPLTPTQRRAQRLVAPVLPEDEQDQTRPKSRDRRAPPSLSLRKSTASNASNGPKALPFREVYGEHSLSSAPPTRTTFVERPGHMNNGPMTGVVPQTPYSAYMPYTPMTPVTPGRLVSKAELKRNKKEAKLKVLSEDDLVVPEDKGY